MRHPSLSKARRSGCLDFKLYQPQFLQIHFVLLFTSSVGCDVDHIRNFPHKVLGLGLLCYR